MKAGFAKPDSSIEQIVQGLTSKGMSLVDEYKVENYMMNIGYHCFSASYLTIL